MSLACVAFYKSTLNVATRDCRGKMRLIQATNSMLTRAMTTGVEPSQHVRKPTLAQAKKLPLSPTELSNEQLIFLSALESLEAREEILKRHIMAIDDVEYVEAKKTFSTIQATNKNGNLIRTLPFKLGVGISVTSAVLSFPLTFHQSTVSWFNEKFVTADVPEPKDMETWLEIGSWSWNWMEPVMGQVSFVLLLLAFARGQIKNLGIKPFTAKMKGLRADNLVQKYPQYNSSILKKYSELTKLND